MKKITILLALSILLLSGCSMLQDLIDNIDNGNNNGNSGNLEIKEHKASFLFDNGGTRAMNILAYTYDDNYFNGVINRCKNNGDTVVYLYTWNKGDGPGTTSFYINDQFNGSIDSNKMNLMKNRMKITRKKDLNIVCWLFPDDNTGKVNFKDTEGLKKYIGIVIANFDEYISEYVVALEADEYLTSAQVNDLASYIKSKTINKPVGCHQVPGRYNYSQNSNIDKHYHQYGFNKSISYIENETKKVKGAIGKPVIAAEYDLSSDSSGAKIRGGAAIRGGASGTGNGRN